MFVVHMSECYFKENVKNAKDVLWSLSNLIELKYLSVYVRY